MKRKGAFVMAVEISDELTNMLRESFMEGYQKITDNRPEIIELAEFIGSQLGIFYLLENKQATDTRVLSFENKGVRHATYFHWSDDLEIQGANQSRFFLLLTEFGLISGVEISHTKGKEYKLWRDFIDEKNFTEIKSVLETLQEKGNFSKDIPLLNKYLEIIKAFEKK